MIVHSKKHLLEQIIASWEELNETTRNLDSKTIGIRIALGTNNVERSIKDHLAHVAAWQELFLDWFATGPEGEPELPAAGYKWSQTPALNEMLFDRWANRTNRSVNQKLKASHAEIVEITQNQSEQKLMTPGKFKWTGRLNLAKYIASSTVSHYRWAIRKTKKTLKVIKQQGFV